MSSMLCQGLQSCLEPRFVEPRALGLKLAPPMPLFSRTMEWSRKSCTADSDSDIEEQNNHRNNNNNNNDDIDTDKSIGGWNLIEALTNTSQQSPINEANKEKESPYVHPLTKRYSSKLSEKSLKLCTENLGCETGTDISENSDISSTTSSDSECGGKSSPSPTRDRQKLRHNWGMNKKVNSGSFPPPLTSISGSNCVQVRPHREGGRLVIKTVVVQSPQTYFQAERRDGRLRLHFSKNFNSSCTTFDSKLLKEAVEGENYDTTEEKEEQEEEKQEQECEIRDEKEQDQEIDLENDYFDDEEETEGNIGNVGGEMGIDKFQRPSRCKESGRGENGLLNWEPFWVAT